MLSPLRAGGLESPHSGGHLQGLPPGTGTGLLRGALIFLAHGEPGATGMYLMIGLHVASQVHMRLRDVLLFRPDFISENQVTIMLG